MPTLSYNRKRLLANTFAMMANKRVGAKKLLVRKILCLILLLSQLACGTPSEAWTFRVITILLPNYLNHEGTLLTKITKASTSYSDADSESSNLISYRDIYYSQTQSIGSIQHHSLLLTRGTRGTIFVAGSSPTISEQEANVLSKVILRLYLELYLQDCHVQEIQVPGASYSLLISALLKNGFQKLPDEGSGRSPDKLVMLHVVADSLAQSEYLTWEQSKR